MSRETDTIDTTSTGDGNERRLGRRPFVRSVGAVGTALVIGAGLGSAGAATQSLPNEIAITKNMEDIKDGVARYRFAVDTELEGTSAEAGEVVNGTHAEGRVGPARGTDAFEFARSVVEFSLEGDAAVLLNGERIDPAVFENTLTIESTADERASYLIGASGQVTAGTDADLSGASHPDVVNGDTATGSVAGGGTDSYYFSGDLTRLSVDGPAAIDLNGDPIKRLPNTLTIESTADERAFYDLSAADRIGAGLDADLTGASYPDTIEGGEDLVAERGTRASGSVAGGGTDSYRFAGELTRLDVRGPAEVRVNRAVIDPDGEPDDGPPCNFEALDFSVESVSTTPSAIPPYSTVSGTATNPTDGPVKAHFDLQFYEPGDSQTSRLDEPRVLTVPANTTDSWELSTEALIDEDRRIQVIPYDGYTDC